MFYYETTSSVLLQEVFFVSYRHGFSLLICASTSREALNPASASQEQGLQACTTKQRKCFFLDRGQNLKAVTLGRGGSISALGLWNLPDPPLQLTRGTAQLSYEGGRMERIVEPRGWECRWAESGSYPPIPSPSAQSDRGTWWTLSCYRQRDNQPALSFIYSSLAAADWACSRVLCPGSCPYSVMSLTAALNSHIHQVRPLQAQSQPSC